MKKRNTDSSQAGPMEEGKPLLEEGKPLLVQRNEKTESMLKHRTTKRFIKILAIMMSVIAVLQVLDIKYKAELETLKKDHVDELNNAKSDNVYKAELKTLKKDHLEELNNAKSDNVYKAELETLKKDHLEELNKAKSDNVYKAELETLKKELIELNNAKSDEVQSPSNYNLAKEQSFGFFDDIDDSNWKHLQTILAEMVDHQVPENPLQHLPTANGGWEGYFAWYQTNYEPNFSCMHERRVGGNGNGDGPKWVCDPHRITRMSKERKAKDPKSPGCVVYSIGSNCDFQFELGMQNTVGVGTCEYHTFDMGNYERCIPEELENAHYHQWGIKTQENTGDEPPQPGQRLYGLKDTMKLLGHDKLDAIDVFKIDCEGCEWASFGDWLDPDMPDLMQILVEIHKPPPHVATKFFDTLHAAGYARFHKEANIQFPSGAAIEYTFLKLAKDFFTESNLALPDGKEEEE